jgi:hypothetical protein
LGTAVRQVNETAEALKHAAAAMKVEAKMAEMKKEMKFKETQMLMEG